MNKEEVVIIRIESYFKLHLILAWKPSVFMQIRCNFPDISYLSETQKNSFQFLNKEWNRESLEPWINEALKVCKAALRQWRESCEPSSKRYPMIRPIHLKQSEMLVGLRKSQRQAEAKRTINNAINDAVESQ